MDLDFEALARLRELAGYSVDGSHDNVRHEPAAPACICGNLLTIEDRNYTCRECRASAYIGDFRG